MKSPAMSYTLPIIVFLIMLPLAGAQQGRQGSGTTGSGNTGSNGSASPATMPRMPASMPPAENRMPEAQTAIQSVYITGSVMQEDGTPPPLGTEIQLDCGYTITREATADSSGRFGFLVGSNNRIGRVMPDASDSISQDTYDITTNSRNPVVMNSLSSFGVKQLSTRLMGCELRAQSPGYRSTSVRLGSGSVLGYNEINPILIYRISKVQGTSVSYASLLAPKEVKKRIERAIKAMQKKKYDEAEALTKSAIEIYPKSAEAWYVLGQTYQVQQNYAKAHESYVNAIAADPLFVRPYITLSRMECEKLKWQAAADFTNKALELDPIAFPEAYYLNALAFYNLKDFKLAEKSARNGERLDMDSQFPHMHLILANILAIRQDTPASNEELRKYLKAAPKAQDAAAVRARLQEKHKLAASNTEDPR
jgi:tetratricopeptide (TPR) repeat protein